MAEPIAYRIFDGQDGLTLANGLLVAYRGGEEVSRAEIAATAGPLEVLLATYEVPNILAADCFSYSGAQDVLDLQATVDFPLPGSLGGHLQSARGQGYWSAERRGSSRFLQTDRLPNGVRNYIGKETEGWGWRIELPGFVRELNDPVLQKRIAVSIEKLLYRLDEDKLDIAPYSFRVNSCFSARRPMWSEPLPFVVDHPADRGK